MEEKGIVRDDDLELMSTVLEDLDKDLKVIMKSLTEEARIRLFSFYNLLRKIFSVIVSDSESM